MRRLSLIGCLLVLTLSLAQADVITLRTGNTVRGEIVAQDEDVVIIKDINGRRFQYLRSDIDSVTVEQQEQNAVMRDETINRSKKVSLSLELAGGGMSVHHAMNGGAFSADLLVGTHNLANKRIFLGGGIGYHGFIGTQTYSFIPLQVALRVPVLEGKHSPQIGVGVGYGFAISSNASSGLYAGLDVGYRYQATEKTAICVSLFAQFQQTKINITETMTDTEQKAVDYTYQAGSNLLAYGLKFALYF